MMIALMMLSALGALEASQVTQPTVTSPMCTMDAGSSAITIRLEGRAELTFTPDGRCLLIGEWSTGRLSVWDMGSGKCVRQWQGNDDGITAMAVDATGHYIACGGYKGSVAVYDISTGKSIASFTGHLKRVNAVAIDIDESLVVSAGNDCMIYAWDITTSRERTSFRADAPVRGFAQIGVDRFVGVLTPDLEKEPTGKADLVLFNDSLEVLSRRPASVGVVAKVVVRPDSKKILHLSAGRIVSADSKTLEEERSMELPGQMGLAVSSYVAVGGAIGKSYGLRILTTDLEEVHFVPMRVGSLAASHAYIAAQDDAEVVHIWNMQGFGT